MDRELEILTFPEPYAISTDESPYSIFNTISAEVIQEYINIYNDLYSRKNKLVERWK